MNTINKKNTIRKAIFDEQWREIHGHSVGLVWKNGKKLNQFEMYGEEFATSVMHIWLNPEKYNQIWRKLWKNIILLPQEHDMMSELFFSWDDRFTEFRYKFYGLTHFNINDVLDLFCENIDDIINV